MRWRSFGVEKNERSRESIRFGAFHHQNKTRRARPQARAISLSNPSMNKKISVRDHHKREGGNRRRFCRFREALCFSLSRLIAISARKVASFFAMGNDLAPQTFDDKSSIHRFCYRNRKLTQVSKWMKTKKSSPKKSCWRREEKVAVEEGGGG